MAVSGMGDFRELMRPYPFVQPGYGAISNEKIADNRQWGIAFLRDNQYN